MILGRRIEFPFNGIEQGIPAADPAPPYVFNRPTDVSFDAQGNIFVADGYINSRIAKYDKYGRFIKQVGSRGSQGPPVHLDSCHRGRWPRAMSTRAAAATRAFVVFDNDLNYKTTYDHVGAPWSLCITAGPHQYLYASNSILTAKTPRCTR